MVHWFCYNDCNSDDYMDYCCDMVCSNGTLIPELSICHVILIEVKQISVLSTENAHFHIASFIECLFCIIIIMVSNGGETIGNHTHTLE